MKTFMIIERQEGGCDYTIGCGVRCTVTSAESLEALVTDMKRRALLIPEWDTDDRFSDLLNNTGSCRSSVEVYEIGESARLPLDAWRKEAAQKATATKRADAEKDERDMLAKLQKKYGARA